MWLDPFTERKFDENSRIIQVEGNVASGKNKFAHQLAEKLGMKVMEPVSLDDYYTNDHGYDYRALNVLLPERLRICDWDMFHENPARHSVIHMQNYLFKMRVFQYLEALRHLFNTGQGVILVRSCFTERVFVEAMEKMGWLPLGYLRGDGVQFYDWKSRYLYVRNGSLTSILKPHLTVYLDTPVETCSERIRNSEDPVIAQSRALVPEFLEEISKAYKEVVLPAASQYGHVLEVPHLNHKTEDEVLDVVDDIADLSFEIDNDDTRFDSWFPRDWWFWHLRMRRHFTTDICLQYIERMNTHWFDIAGLGDSITQADLKLRDYLYYGHVGSLGQTISRDQDYRIENLMKVLFGRHNFGDRLRYHLKSDFE